MVRGRTLKVQGERDVRRPATNTTANVRGDSPASKPTSMLFEARTTGSDGEEKPALKFTCELRLHKGFKVSTATNKTVREESVVRK